jgi:hypothetical protein
VTGCKLLSGPALRAQKALRYFHSVTLQPSTPLHSTPLHSTPLHSTPLHSTPLHSTPLHSTPPPPQPLLQGLLTGRALGAELTALLLHTANVALLWRQHAAVATTAATADGSADAQEAVAARDDEAVQAYLDARGSLLRVLERLLGPLGCEHLVQPESLLSTAYNDGNVDSDGCEVPAGLTSRLSAGVMTVADLAFQLSADQLLLAAHPGLVQAAGGVAALAPSGALLHRYCCLCLMPQCATHAWCHSVLHTPGATVCCIQSALTAHTSHSLLPPAAL